VKSIITNLDPRPAQLNSSLVANVPQLSNERLETPPRKDLGRITFTPLYSNTNISLGDGITRGAYPIFNFIKQYPVLHEIVYIIPGPDSDLNDNVDAQSYYYFPPYSIWNFPNHGGSPNLE
jgi:hypothetical protein